MVGMQDPDFRTSAEDGEMAAAEIYAYCDAIADDRRRNPRDDIMTALVQAEIDGDRLSKEELNMFFVVLVVAGNETTRNLIAHSMLAIIEHPDARAELVSGIDDEDAVDDRHRGVPAVGQLDPELPADRHRGHLGRRARDQGGREGRHLLRRRQP